MTREDSSDPELRDYVQILRRRKWLVACPLVAVVGGVLAMSAVQTPVYAAEARLLLRPRVTESLFDPNTGQRSEPERALQTEIELLESEPVRQAVRDNLGFSARISGRAISQTDVIKVRAESTVPERAAAIADAFATAFIDLRRKQTVDDILAAGGEIETRVKDLQGQIDALDERLRVELSRATPDNQGAVLQSLGSQKDALVQQQGLFKQKLDELKVDSALKTGGAQLVEQAPIPRSPVRPRPVRNAALASVLGLVLGGVLALVRDYFDDSIKTKEDLERAVPGVATIGIIPSVAGWKAREEPRLVAITEPKSSPAEAYRTLRTSIQFLGLDRPLRTLQVTSANAGEGKTTTLANLGVTLANAGRTVVMVCCDLRRPRIHEFFGLDNRIGFTSVLLRETPLLLAVQRIPDVPRLALLASGPLPPNPSEMLSSPRTAEVLKGLLGGAEVVLIDSPPVLPVTDSLVLSRAVEGTLIVATARTTSRKQASRAAELLQQVDARVIGTVLNGVSGESPYSGSYEYHPYAQEERNEGVRGSLRRAAAREATKG